MKPLGRPALDPEGGESVSLSVRISAKQFDELYREASARRVSLSEWIRQRLDAALRRQDTRQL
jgi:predicted HicB family RNase H-like nuclease